jgi:hypothetical protein
MVGTMAPIDIGMRRQRQFDEAQSHQFPTYYTGRMRPTSAL